ncbi:MAG: endonuclease MutS2 [Clostridiales bacterium]|nr:endonuclease MutS2 [Clostridiales bacterium]
MREKTLIKLEYDKMRERLAERASFACSKELALALQPAGSAAEAAALLEESVEAREILRFYPTFSLGGLRDLRPALRHIEVGGILDVPSLLDVADVCRAARQSKTFFSEIKGSYPTVTALGKSLGLFKTIESAVEKTVAGDGGINDEASEKLFQLRRRQRSAAERVKERLEGIVKSPNTQRFLQEPIVTMRAGRHVVPVKVEYRAQVPGIMHDTSASGATLFIEPMAVIELNNELQRLAREEEEEIAAILRALTLLMTGFADDLAATLSRLARLDFIFAKARLSYDYNGAAPKINERGHIRLNAARHPLIDPAKVVPVEIRLEKDVYAMVVTGPNTGGKTVTLKTIGLLTLMALSGLEIPAEAGSEISFFAGVFADIGDEQSIEQSLSTFSSHMVSIVEILQNVRGDSLVLLDELGAGTDPAEGAALAMALLDTLKRRGAKTVATTHYSELKAFAYNNPGFLNASMEFDLETLSPTFRLLMGVPGKSNAFEISRRLGLPETVIGEAARFLTAEDAQIADLLANLEEARRQAVREKEEARAALARAEEKEKELQREQDSFKIKEAEIVRGAHERSREIVAETMKKSEALYREMQGKMQEERERERAWQESKRKLKTWQEQLEEEQPEIPFAGQAPASVMAGQTVFVPRFNQKCVVLSPPNSGGEVAVRAGVLKMMLPLSDLRLAEEEKTEETKKRNSGAMQREKAMSIKSEADLRGLDSLEALEALDKYLDDAFVAGLKQVRIIHGKGTGALRAAVATYLKGNRLVKSFKAGEYHDGGIGVTIAELNL